MLKRLEIQFKMMMGTFEVRRLNIKRLQNWFKEFQKWIIKLSKRASEVPLELPPIYI